MRTRGSDLRGTAVHDLFVVGGKWKPLILFHLARESRRYGDLRRAVGGVTDKVFIQQLKELEADGVVARFDHREVPPRVEYSLTPFGRTLGKAVMPLCEWGTRYCAEIERMQFYICFPFLSLALFASEGIGSVVWKVIG